MEDEEKESVIEEGTLLKAAKAIKGDRKFELLTAATSTASAISFFKERDVVVTAEEIEKEGHPVEDALKEYLPIFDNIPELKEIKVGFEVEFKEAVKGGVGVKLVILSSDVAGETTTGNTHRVEFLLKNPKQ